MFLPLVVLLGGLIVAGTVADFVEKKEMQDQTNVLNDKVILLGNDIEKHVNSELLALRRMAKRWEENGGTPKDAWLQDAASYVKDHSGLSVLEWVDKTYHVRWIEPLEGNEKAEGLYIIFDDKREQALKGASDAGTITLTPPLDLVQGYRAFIAYVPVYVEGEFDGFIVGVFDIKQLISNYLAGKFFDDYQVHLSMNELPAYGMVVEDEWVSENSFRIHDAQWTIKVRPSEVWFENHTDQVSALIRICGIVVSLFLSGMVLMSQSALRFAKKAQESHKETKVILKHAIDGIYGLDLEGKTTFANPSALELTGYTEEEMLGVMQHSLIHHSHADGSHYPREECNIYKAVNEGVSQTVSTEVFWRKDGSSFPVEYTSSPTFDEDGKITGAMVVFRDISERRAAEGKLMEYSDSLELQKQELEIAKNKAEESTRLKSDFLANMSHEIRTPMNAIIGFADLLTEANLKDQERDYLETIQESGGILLELINNILDLSKIENEKIELEALPFNLMESVDGAIKIASVKIGEKPVSFHRLCAVRNPGIVLGDPVRVQQILLNLMSNAVKFTDDGVIEVRVYGKVEEKGEDGIWNLSVEVRDTGIGIPQDKLDLIFESFTQSDSSTTRKYEGTGLGLPISKRLAQLMGGDIEVESEIGIGSCFRLHLPMNMAKAVEEKPSGPVAEMDTGVNGCKVLLVEDNRTNQKYAKAILKRLGCRFIIAETGRQAIQALKEREFDVCLMDLHMPDMGGLETTQIIRLEMGMELPIIALTAAAMEEDRQACLKVGMNGFLKKPFKASELKVALREVMLAPAILPACSSSKACQGTWRGS